MRSDDPVTLLSVCELSRESLHDDSEHATIYVTNTYANVLSNS